jgi:hypothetical protein
MQDVSGDPAAAAAEFEIVIRGLDPASMGLAGLEPSDGLPCRARQ